MTTLLYCPRTAQIGEGVPVSWTMRELDDFISHLEECEACRAAAEAAGPEDPLIQLLRQAPIADAGGPEIAQLVSRMCGLVSGQWPPPVAGSDTIDDASAADSVSPTDVGTVDYVDRPAHKKTRTLPVVPGYEIVGELGRGGMGVVYQARHLELKRTVALKMILAASHASSDQIGRFRAEAEAVARLQHPNIVQIYEIGVHEELPFFSLEFVNGGTLDKFLAGAPQPARDAAYLVSTLARAMQVAHDAGIVHRDLKPANVLLHRHGEARSGTDRSASGSASSSQSSKLPDNLQTVVPKVSDFGLAKQLDGDDGRTASGAIMGTPSYMAPEQATGHIDEISPVTDVYALGAILYETLTGRPPFRGATTWETLDQVRTQEPVAPRQLQPRLPRDLETICLKCLRKEKRQRYQSAVELADDLQRFLANEPVHARPVGKTERAWRWACRNPWQAALLGLSVAVFVLVVGGGFWVSARVGEADFQTKLEEEKRKQVEERAAVDTFWKGFLELRERRNTSEAGWTWSTLEKLRGFLEKYPKAKELPPFQAEVILALASVDARLLREVGQGLLAANVAFSPDGKLVAIGQQRADDAVLGACEIRLIDPATGQKAREFRVASSFLWQLTAGKQDGVRTLAFSPDGKWLVAGTRSGMLHRWNLREEKPQPVSWQAHAKSIEALRFDARGTALFSLSGHDMLRRWDTADWKLQATLKHGNLTEQFGYDPSAEVLTVAIGHAVLVVDAEFLHVIREIPIAAGQTAYTADGRMLIISSSRASTIELVDLLANRVAGQLRLPDKNVTVEGSVDSLALSPDGTLLAISSTDTRRVQLWNLLDYKLVVDLHVGGDDKARMKLAFSPDGQLLAVTGDRSTLLFAIRADRIFTRHALATQPVRDLTLCRQGNVYATCEDDDAVAKWRYCTWHTPRSLTPEPRGARTFLLHTQGRAEQMGLSRTGDRLAFSTYTGLLVLDGVNQQWPIHGNQQLHAWGPDDRLWTTASTALKMWSNFPFKEIGNWDNGAGDGRGRLTCIHVGSHFALVGTRDGTLNVFDPQGPRHVRSISTSETRAPLTSVALTADESLAAVGNELGELIVVRVPGGEIVARAKHQEFVTGVAFLNPTVIATSSQDRSIRIWQLDPGGQVETLRLPCPGIVRRLHATPDARQLLIQIAGERGVRCWHLDDLVQELTEMGLETPRLAFAPRTRIDEKYQGLPDGPGIMMKEFWTGNFNLLSDTKIAAQVNYDWGLHHPSPGLLDDDFSMRWRGWLTAPRPGKYHLELEADDGVRLWVNGKLVIDHWLKGASKHQHEIQFADEPHSFRLDYCEISGVAFCKLRWAQKQDGQPLKFEPIPPSAFFTSRAAALKGKAAKDK